MMFDRPAEGQVLPLTGDRGRRVPMPVRAGVPEATVHYQEHQARDVDEVVA